MKRILKWFCLVMTVVLMIQAVSVPLAYGEGSTEEITILFTHDMHDHFLPSLVKQDGRIQELGGYARLYSAIEEERERDANVLLVDAGDFSMGTLFQTIFSSESPSLRAMGAMGYDVVTLGNHEYDFRANGLAQSLEAAVKSGDPLPQIVQSNISFPTDKEGKTQEALMSLKKAMENYGVKDYTVLEKGGMKVGIFGLMGKEADSNAPMAGVVFNDAVENAKRAVKQLKDQEKVDMIICLSHSGTSENAKRSEDQILAEKVPGIDVIISGHSHTKLMEPITVGKTLIASAGAHGESLGVLRIAKDPQGTWKLKEYGLRQIDDSLMEDVSLSQQIQRYKEMVQTQYLDRFNMKFEEILAYSPFNFVETAQIGAKHQEDPLGNLISDAYIFAVRKAEEDHYKPVDVALVPSGTIRGSFVEGNITVADAFTASSLGFGADGLSGYPLVSVYLTGKELKAACEVDASIAPIMSSAQLYMSGMQYTFNPNRLIFNKVTRAVMQKPDGSLEEIDDDKLYRVVGGLYSAQMLSVVGKKSFGLLSIEPKDEAGKPITNFEDHIISYSVDGQQHEMKEWLAVAEYLKSFDKVNGIPRVPEYYNALQGRKVVEDRRDLSALLSHPNGISLGIYTGGLLIIGLGILMIFKIVNRKKYRGTYRPRRKKNRVF